MDDYQILQVISGKDLQLSGYVGQSTLHGDRPAMWDSRNHLEREVPVILTRNPLTPEQEHAIRMAWAMGYSQTALARKFRVGKARINDLLRTRVPHDRGTAAAVVQVLSDGLAG
jgi:hypothetical protein